MAYGKKNGGKMKSYSGGSDGKQGIKAGSDCGAHAAFQSATSPASVKSAAKSSTPYKHR